MPLGFLACGLQQSKISTGEVADCMLGISYSVPGRRRAAIQGLASKLGNWAAVIPCRISVGRDSNVQPKAVLVQRTGRMTSAAAVGDTLGKSRKAFVYQLVSCGLFKLTFTGLTTISNMQWRPAMSRYCARIRTRCAVSQPQPFPTDVRATDANTTYCGP